MLNAAGTVLAQAMAPSAGSWHHIAYVHDPSQSTPASRDKIYIEGTAAIGTGVGHDTGPPTAMFIGATSPSANHYTGALDDVRVYNTALTPAQVTSLSLGRYAGTGGAATLTLAGGDTTIPPNSGSGCNSGQGYGLSLDSGSLYTSDLKLTVRLKSAPVRVNSGTLHIGSDIFNGDGGLTVNPMGTLLMDQTAGQLQPGVNTAVIIDGTLIASNAGAIIQRDNGGERYAFAVGSFASSRPVLNITGLAIRDTDANGLLHQCRSRRDHDVHPLRQHHLPAWDGKVPRPSRRSSLYLAPADACSVSGTAPARSRRTTSSSTGNGTSDGETRVIFGSATCHANKTTSGRCQDSWALDDDPDNDGVGDSPASNGAVVQYVHSADNDTAGTVEGFPTAAFDWNTFTYYSTYVAFHDASGTADRIYVRRPSRPDGYHWDTPAATSTSSGRRAG